METEIEAIFTNVDKGEVRTKLHELGAELVCPERLQKRKNYDPPTDKGWIRVRDEGNKVTLTYKRMENRSIDGMKEINIVVDDFDTTDSFLQTIGIPVKSYQETKRESWLLNGVEIEIDEWPWLPPFVEIEGDSIERVEKAAKKLDFDMKDATYGAVNNLYAEKYKLNKDNDVSFTNITFDKDCPWESRG